MKKLLTSFISIMLVFVMLFGMTACNPDDSGNGDGTQDGGEDLPTDSEGNTVYNTLNVKAAE